VRVALGEHTLEARDAATGEVVDRSRVHIGWLERGAVYAPARSAETCLYLQRLVYGSPSLFGEGSQAELLDPSSSAWAIGAAPDYVMEVPPEQITISNRSSSETRWALRLGRCRPADRPDTPR
jgi:hypothetical protein